MKNINNILLILTSILFASMALSCKDDESVFVVEGSGSGKNLIIATLGSDTRAYDGHFNDDPFAEGNYEEAINRAELFFFESANDTQKAFHHISVKDIKKITRAELTVKIPMTKIEFFKRSGTSDERKAYVYAIVNLPDRSELPSDEEATLENLENIRIEEPGFTSATPPGEFVMRGGQNVTLTDENGEATIKGWIPVSRVAAKVRMFCNIKQYVYLDKDGKTIYQREDEMPEEWEERAKREAFEVWESVPQTEGIDEGKDNTFLYFYNFTTNAQLNGSSGGKDSQGNFSRHNWLTYDNIDRSENRINLSRVVKTGIDVADYSESIAGSKKVDRERYPYTHEWAYYSYPNAWNSYDIEEQHATNVTMRLQWKQIFMRENDSDDSYAEKGPDPDNIQYEYFYYQIPVNRLSSKKQKDEEKPKEDNDRIDSNMYYRILIDIAMLGARDLGTPIEVDASWEAIPWSNATVDVNIKGRRYLVVNQTEWEMNNVHTLQIPYSTSHPTEVTCYVTYFRYNDAWGIEPLSHTPKLDSQGNQTGWNSIEHNSQEFDNWLKAAAQLKDSNGDIVGREGEGEIRAVDFNGVNRILYYKKKYFYDEYYDKLQMEDGYKYYVGREHPITVQPDKRVKPASLADNEGWKEYNRRYDNIDAVYTCEKNDDSGVIDFIHPLIQWEEKEVNGEVQYYVPKANPHNGNPLWDEFSRCEITIIIRHADRPKDEHLFEEVIHITQYPGMYVEVSHNYGTVYKFYDEETGIGATPNQADRGNEYVSINGSITENFEENPTLSTEWYETSGYVRYYGSINNNPNMYVIHTTQLSEENEVLYNLGDPRALAYNNQLSDDSFPYTSDKEAVNKQANTQSPIWSFIRFNGIGYGAYGIPYAQYDNYSQTLKTAPHAHNRKLTSVPLRYYYPTDESTGAGSKENFIAPSFRIASSFGKVSLTYSFTWEVSNAYTDWINYNVTWGELKGKSRAEARRRCAAYQEAGRPAGRWRVPTYAEIEYLLQLSTDGKIPHLFGLNGTDEWVAYWSANGLVVVNLEYSGKKIKYIDTEDDLTNSPAVRCIYDEWYWTKIDEQNNYSPTPLETEFMWGDVRKDRTQ